MKTTQRQTSRKLLLLTLSLLIVGSLTVNPLVGAQDILFFSRSADIGETRVWVVDEFGEGAVTLDLTVMRWDATAKQWSECETGLTCNTNELKLAWNMPVYSPVDGEVKTCWRGFPDNSPPGTKLSGVGSTIFGAGNHLNIQTSQGNVIILAHLKQDSIPERLCPAPRSARSSNSTKPPGFDYPPPSVIPIGSRPKVQRGEFVGSVGNSGNSGQPHVHINMQKAATDTTEDPPFAMKFIQGWSQVYEKKTPASKNWVPLKSTPITSASGLTMFHPSPFLRRGSITAGPIFDVDLVDFPSSGQVVTAVSDAQRNLKLISWSTTGKEFTRKSEISAGRISEIKMVRDANNLVTAVRDGSNDLKLILYSVGSNGQLVRRADASAGSISRLSATVTRQVKPKIVTAVRDSSGNLKIIVWQVTASGIQRLGQASAGPVGEVAVTEARNFHGVITAVREQSGKLKVIPWRISADGLTVTRGKDSEAGIVSQVSITSIQRAAVVAVRDAEANLRVITFELSPGGDIVARRETELAGKIAMVDIDTTPDSGSNVVTTVKDGSGSLRLIAWTMDPTGRNLRRGSASDAGGIGAFSAVGSSRQGSDIILTAMKDSQSNLRLIYWDANLSP